MLHLHVGQWHVKVTEHSFHTKSDLLKRLDRSPAMDLLVIRIHYTRLNTINKPEIIMERKGPAC
jgi:hypothetical protein